MTIDDICKTPFTPRHDSLGAPFTVDSGVDASRAGGVAAHGSRLAMTIRCARTLLVPAASVAGNLRFLID
ncbi:hypothetical protein LAJ19_14380 (plasmid) [Deinococcus taeanensis]|uniref:hypothetical protein n=1 Tax=Deinococcus taeanensis TaxID=2737050 RepID=UPI001CDB87C7|nr:hypothetical protein [Deinococcus taeanensis]UBV44351.1 hypothetical protein LAJ19_14380 [Deinococcus taeanensis]